MVSNLLNFLRGAAVGGGAAGGSSEGCDAALPECRPTWGWSRAAAFRSLEELLEFLDATSTSTRAAGDVDGSRGVFVAVAVRSKAALERCACAVWLCVCTWGATAALSAASLASAAFTGGSIVAAIATASAAAVAAVCGGARGSARCACMRCVHMCARYNTVSVDRCPMWTRLLSVSSA